jgi:hypothetical protein
MFFLANTVYKNCYIFWLILAQFEHFIIDFLNPIPLMAPELVFVCCFGIIHLPHTESTWSQTLSTEYMRSETPRQRKRHQHLRRFCPSMLTQLTWSLTWR